MFESIMTSIGNAVGVWLYVIAGGLCFAEAAILVGLVLPGETALLVAGVFAQRGVLNLWLMIVIAAACAVLGDSVGYEFGKKYGPAFRRSKLGVRVGEPRWNAVDEFITRHGGKAILLGRLTALFRALVPSMAGMSGMRYRTFITWNALGGLIWAPGCVLLGYAFSTSHDVIGSTLTWAPLAIVGVALIAYVVVHLRKRKRDTAMNTDYEATQPGAEASVEPSA